MAERLYPTPKEGIYGKAEKPERVTTQFGGSRKDKGLTAANCKALRVH